MASEPKRLIVTGATGKQGGALIEALLSRPSQPFEIYAVTRNPSSPASQALRSRSPSIHVIEGDFSSPAAIFAQVPKPWGLFSVTAPEFGKKGAALVEERQGKAMTSAALEAGVEHIVYTSVDRGGDAASDGVETPIPHFRSKKLVEDDLRAKTSSGGTTWTIIRPVCFMDNLSDDFVGKGFLAMWRQNGARTKLQMVGCRDIGRVAADALVNADKDEYRNKAISLAGDEVSPEEAERTFKEVTGRNIPSTFGFVGSALKFMMKDELGRMFAWFKEDGYGADVEGLRKRYPFLKSFRQWVEEESAWRKK